MSDNSRNLCLSRRSVLYATLGCIMSLVMVACVLPANARQYTPTSHSEFQAVYDDGTGSWGGGGFYPVEMIGVVINNPWQMLNYETDASPQWQVFFQAVDPNDFGGTAMYMRRYHPMTGADLFAGTQWNEEMQRLNYPVDESIGMPVDEPLRYDESFRCISDGTSNTLMVGESTTRQGPGVSHVLGLSVRLLFALGGDVTATHVVGRLRAVRGGGWSGRRTALPPRLGRNTSGGCQFCLL